MNKEQYEKLIIELLEFCSMATKKDAPAYAVQALPAVVRELRELISEM